MLSRLEHSLRLWQPDATWDIQPGTAGVASPHRVATEWAGFRLRNADKQFYAKVMHEDQQPLLDINRSATASRAAARQGITPPLIHMNSELGVLIFAALDESWHWATLDQLTQPQNFQTLTKILDLLHQITLPLPSRQDDLKALRQFCQLDGVTLPAEVLWLGECVDMAWQALTAQPCAPVLLHGDPIASNWLVNSEGEWQLLDFDCAAQGDAWYDIAVLLNEQMPFDDQWREVIHNWRGSCSEADYARCRLYALADDYYWTLWGLWNGHTSSRGLEFTKVGQWSLLRCRQSAGDPRFARWLALVAGSVV